ncbi:MAG: NAD(P)(+) transhydrogenase (Re/Si-specific) subunit alpha, partial [Myxococcota bacterium]
GKKAPTLITADMVQKMRPGAVIIDLAVESGGNCELSQPNQTVTEHGVHIVGDSNLPSSVPHDASLMFARNVLALIQHITDGAELKLTPDDEVAGPALLVYDGQVVHERTRAALESQ